MRRRGKPPRHKDLRAAVAAYLLEHPQASASTVATHIGARRQEVLSIVRELRGVPISLANVRVVSPEGGRTVFDIGNEDQLPRNLWGDLVRLRDGYRCQACGSESGGEQQTRVHAHHMNRDPTNNRLSNGITLCTGCHSAVHRELNGAGAKQPVPPNLEPVPMSQARPS